MANVYKAPGQQALNSAVLNQYAQQTWQILLSAVLANRKH